MAASITKPSASYHLNEYGRLAALPKHFKLKESRALYPQEYDSIAQHYYGCDNPCGRFPEMVSAGA